MKRYGSRAIRVSITYLLTSVFLLSFNSPAFAIDYTVTYNANSGYVGSVAQAGITTGNEPTSPAQASGTTYTVLGPGNLARQGFTFDGWNTSQDGTGSSFSAGSTFTLTTNRTLYAKWSIPKSARLIGNGGSIKTVVNSTPVSEGDKCVGAGVRGITSDGTHIYFRPSTNPGYICKVTTEGVVVSVHLVSGLSAVASDQLALVFGNGCLFLRKDPLSTFNSVYCIALNNWSLNSISLTGGTLPTGGTWLYGNFIQFPDGRIGSVGTSTPAASWPGGVGTTEGKCPSGMHCKTLRLFNVSGSGASVTTSFSADFILADILSGWPSDDHGIATDGTYLYQIRHANGYKVWALRSNGPSYLVFNGDGTGTCGASTGVTGTQCTITYPVTGASAGGAFANTTYFGRAHGLSRYLVGDYDGLSKFWLSDSAIPPDGPGNPDVVAPQYTSADTFTVTENIATSFNAATITVSESATMTIAAGSDGARFDIIRAETSTSYIRFKISPDFEAPTDTGSNNVYEFTMSSVDLAGNTGTRLIYIRVTNLNENSVTSAPSISGNAYKGVPLTMTVTVNAPGKIRFFMDGKRIASCLSKSTTGSYPNYTASCTWKPTVMAQRNITATLTPSDNTFAPSTSAVTTLWVLKRTTLR